MSPSQSGDDNPQFLRDDTIHSQLRASQPVLDPQHVLRPSDGSSDNRVRDGRTSSTMVEVSGASERTPLLQHLPPSDDDVLSAELIPTSKMFRQECVTLIQYSLPILGSQLFEYSFVVVSVISIGHISTAALAGATLGSMTAGVTGYSILYGFVSTLDTLLPPAWTSDTPYMVGLWSQRMMLFIAILIVPILIIWGSVEPVLLALNQEPEVARLASIFLRCASFGLPAFGFNLVSRRYFQSQNLFDVPTRITLVIAPINVFLNWLFVYPLGLSFPGAPLATSLSYNLVSLTSLIYGICYTPPTAWSPITRESFHPTKGELWKGWGLLAKLGISGVFQVASEWWSWELTGLAASQLGSVALAAQSVLLMSASTMYQAPYALSIAASVRIGNLLGEGNGRRAGVAATTSIVIAALMGCVFSVIFLTFRHNWGYIFNNDPLVVSLVASILPFVGLFQVFDATAGIVNGIYRARGKQFTSAILNFTAYYTFGIPLGLYLAFVQKFGLVGLWEGLTLALAYCSIVGILIGVRGVDWKAEVAKAQERVRSEDGDVRAMVNE